MMEKHNKPVKRSLEIVHEGVNFDFCRRLTLREFGRGLCRVKMEAFILPKRDKNSY